MTCVAVFIAHYLLTLQCQSGIGTNAMYQQLYTDPAKLMILGAGCSTVSQATAQASHLWNLVQVSSRTARSVTCGVARRHRRWVSVFDDTVVLHVFLGSVVVVIFSV